MAQAMHMSSGATVTFNAAAATGYFRLGCNMRMGGSTTTESNRVMIWRSPGTFINLYINLLTNTITAASTFRTRKGTNNANLVCSLTASTSGKFEDTSNSDVVSAGDDWHYSFTPGGTGTSLTFRVASIIFSASVNTVSHIGGGSGGATIAEASSTNPGCLYGDGEKVIGGVDSGVGFTSRTAGTLTNFFMLVVSNARTTTTTIRSRINSANGNMALSIIASATGNFEDTSNSDTIASGDLINWNYTTGTGTESLGFEQILADFTTINNNQQYVFGDSAGTAVAAGTTTYAAVSGRGSFNTTEATVAAEPNILFKALKLQCNISANTIVLDSTIRFRKNGEAGNQVVTITALTTGIFQDTTNLDTVIAADTVNYEVVTPSTATSITVNSISVLGEVLSGGGIMTTRTGYWGDL